MNDDKKELNQNIICAQNLKLGYDKQIISENLSLAILRGKITVIIGPNACGKSTLLRGLSRLIKPLAGQVILDGKAINKYSTKQLAKSLGFLPQTSSSPSGITVFELVARGRFPYQGLLKRWSVEDERAVQSALKETQLLELSECYVDELSGGQRQRVWLALVLAQQTDLLLLDEPTTYLDISHQLEVLELCKKLNLTKQNTLVMVLHDLNLAARYADHLIVMKDGKIKGSDSPQKLINPSLLKEVFGIEALVTRDPVSKTPLVIPIT